MITVTCKDCRFYCVDGTCRRFPPAGRPSCWPTLNANDWCGEFEAKKNMIPPQEIPYVDINVAPATPKEQPEPSGMQPLEEGVAPKIRFQRKKPVSDLKEIQETPLFGG
jgi:hypothetical protein